MVRLAGNEDRAAQLADLVLQVFGVRDVPRVHAFRLTQNTGGARHFVGGCGDHARGVVVLFGEFAELLIEVLHCFSRVVGAVARPGRDPGAGR
jgi:hypothetical protein